jgi:hypothetical protein
MAVRGAEQLGGEIVEAYLAHYPFGGVFRLISPELGVCLAESRRAIRTFLLASLAASTTIFTGQLGSALYRVMASTSFSCASP